MSPIFVGNRRIYGPESSDPGGLGANDEGSIVYNTADDKLKSWDGSAWNALGGGGPSLGDGSSASSAPPHARELALHGYASGVYWIKPTGAGVAKQTYVDMSNDDGSGGGWVKIHNAWTGSSSDRTNSGANESTLQQSTHQSTAAIMPSTWMNAASWQAWRVKNEQTGGGRVRLYWAKTADQNDGTVWAYIATDAASNGGDCSIEGSYKWGNGPTADGGTGWQGGTIFYDSQNSNHGLCLGAFGGGATYVSGAGNFHICINRWCCGGTARGMWFNGFNWPAYDDDTLLSAGGNVYHATGWAR